MDSPIYSTVACNLDVHLLQATLPLLEAEQVAAIEWSFDALFQFRTIPDWFTELITTFSDHQRLIGHGVFFSLFSGNWSPAQQAWLKHLQQLSQQYHFDHITEHFGFMTGADFHRGAPLSVPLNQVTLDIGIDRLKRISEACSRPVGLENLAFAYSLEEVKRQGDFLLQLIEPVNGFIILDLHNLYCQLHNFDLALEELIPYYPLDRVREIHISGGSWENSAWHPAKPVRRDTHDHSVPEEVFQLLGTILPRCPNLKYVVLEQLGTSLHSAESQVDFQADFSRMDRIVQEFNHMGQQNEVNNTFISPIFDNLPINSLTDNELHLQQRALATILETADSVLAAQQALMASPLAQSDWETEKWSPYMLEAAIAIAQKWK